MVKYKGDAIYEFTRLSLIKFPIVVVFVRRVEQARTKGSFIIGSYITVHHFPLPSSFPFIYQISQLPKRNLRFSS